MDIAATNIETTTKADWYDKLPVMPTVQRGLLGLTAVSSIIAVIPPLRLIGAIAMRVLGLLSLGVQSSENFANKTWQDHALDGSKMAVAGVGLVALGLMSPVLFVAGLAADIAIELFEAGHAIKNGEIGMALLHLTVVVVDALMITAIVTGGWQFLVAAAVTSFVAMGVLCFAAMTQDPGASTSGYDFFCYWILLATSGVATCMSAKSTYQGHWADYNVTNKGDQPMTIVDRRGNEIGVLQPGESKSFTVPYKLNWNGNEVRGVLANGDNIVIEGTARTVTVVSHKPLAVEHFPTVPVLNGTMSETIVRNETLQEPARVAAVKKRRAVQRAERATWDDYGYGYEARHFNGGWSRLNYI